MTPRRWQEAKQTYTVNNRFLTQPSCLYLGTTRVTSRRNAPLPSSDILLSPWRQTGAGVRESRSASEISGEKKEGVSAIVARPYWYAAADFNVICCG